MGMCVCAHMKIKFSLSGLSQIYKEELTTLVVSYCEFDFYKVLYFFPFSSDFVWSLYHTLLSKRAIALSVA